jgi:hypothetical protein
VMAVRTMWALGLDLSKPKYRPGGAVCVVVCVCVCVCALICACVCVCMCVRLHSISYLQLQGDATHWATLDTLH